MAVVAAPAIGPTLGGWITDNLDWRWVFLINVPVGAVLLLLAQRMVHDPPALVAERARRLREGVRIDYIGFALLTLGLGTLQVVLDRGQQDDWFGSSFITACALVSLVAVLYFVAWELAQRRPDRGPPAARQPKFRDRQPADVHAGLHPARLDSSSCRSSCRP